MAGENEFVKSLPPEFHTDEYVNRFNDLSSLIKAGKEADKYISSTGRLPREDSKTEDWDKFYKSWGRPGKPEEYKLPDLPPEYPLEDEFKVKIMSMAHELGLNQKQFNQMILWGMNTSKEIFTKQNEQKTFATKELEKKWGFRFKDKAERAQKTIAMLVDYKTDDPFVKWLESTGNDTNPTILEFFDRMAERFGEDNFVSEHVKQEASDRASAEKRIREIYADTKGAYFNENDPRHKDALEEMAKLHEVAYPEG